MLKGGQDVGGEIIHAQNIEILRLKFGHGLSSPDIALSVEVSRNTVVDYLLRAQAAGLLWPLPENLDEAALERYLFPFARKETPRSQPTPDWIGSLSGPLFSWWRAGNCYSGQRKKAAAPGNHEAPLTAP